MSTSLVAELASRVQRMEGRAPDAHRALPIASVLQPVLPSGLMAGSCYAVRSSLGLAMGLIAEASDSGEWCGVVGIPHFGAEAAATMGVDLSRILLVPEPKEDWLTVVATLVEVVPMVLVRPPSHLAPKELNRLESRIRQQGSVLIAAVEGEQRWPRAAATIDVCSSRWSGIESGRGMLSERELTVRVSERWGQSREVSLIQRQGTFVEVATSSPRLRAVG